MGESVVVVAVIAWMVGVVGLPGAGVAPAAAQTPAGGTNAGTDAGADPPPIRRWVDVQQLQLSSRFRWFRSSDGRVLSSTLQWQPQVRARFLADRAGRYSLHVGAFSGSALISGWNNTGAGMGRFAGRFSVKQLFVQARPAAGLEIEAGSLYAHRGEVTEALSYDNDTYVTGERVTYRPSTGVIAQVSGMAGYLGDLHEPNVFRRMDRLGEWNFAQMLVGLRLHRKVTATADYVYQDGRDILREGVTVRVSDAPRGLVRVHAESYQRLSPDRAAGVHVSGDLRLARAVSATIGVVSVDRRYGPWNGDRYEVGTRVYSVGAWALTKDLSIGYFVGRAFATDYPIPNRDRFEFIVTYNPTGALKRARVF